MSERPRKPPIITSIADTIDDIDFDFSPPLLVISSVCPEASIASAILCRGLIRTQKPFHLTFLDPAVKQEELSVLISSYPSCQIIVVGISIIDDSPLNFDGISVLSLGSLLKSSSGDLHSIHLANYELGVACYMLVRNHLVASEEDLAIAAVCALLNTDNSYKSSKYATETIDVAMDLKLISSKKELRLFGVNFMPLNELFTKSIHPYIEGISGNSSAADKLFDSAQISYSHRTNPVTNLNNDQIKQLSGALLPQVRLNVIPYVSGLDYLLITERKDSPFYRLSAIFALTSFAWANSKPGLITSALIGDRARLLRELLDLYKNSAVKIIDAVSELALTLNSSDAVISEDNDVTLIKFDKSSPVLSMVGPIAIQNEFFENNPILLFNSTKELTIVWRKGMLELIPVLSILKKSGLDCKSLSYQSIAIQKTSSNSASEVISIIGSILEEKIK